MDQSSASLSSTTTATPVTDLPTGSSESLLPPISLSIDHPNRNSNDSEESSDTTGSSASIADTLMATQAIINRQAERLDGLKEDVKKIQDSVKSILENDQELAIAQEQLKEVSKKHKERKDHLSKSAESTQLKFKLKEMRDQIKELEESLNNHLINYFQMTGTKVFDTDAGDQREFKLVARVLAKKS